MSKESRFEQLKRDIHAMIMKEISEAISREPSKGFTDTVSKCGKLLEYLDETTIKYLMKLTNEYIRVKREQDERQVQAILNIFKKYDFDARNLDEKIPEIQYPYNVFNKMWPNKIQEEIMGIVFSYFECPEDKKLPTVDKILELASKFGATYGATVSSLYDPRATYGATGSIGHDSYEIKWLDTSYFDDPNNICKYLSTAIANGLSIDQIIHYREKIDTYMDYYSAPIFPSIFTDSFLSKSVTTIVGNLEEDHRRMSMVRAKNFYETMYYRLAQENSRLKSQLSYRAIKLGRLVPTDAEVTDEATDSHGAK